MAQMTVPAPQALDVPLGEAALAWVAAGWDVFPIVPRGKTPFGEGQFCGRTDDHSCGFHCATGNVDQITAWWLQHPDSNIGLSSDSAFVVDEDRLGAVKDAGIALPRCPYATTGRSGGGRHFFLRAPADWSGLAGDAVKVTYKVPAVEVKGFGKGYVVAAPSIHSSGSKYAVQLGGHMPEVPQSVITKLVDVERIAAPGTFIRIAGAGYALPRQVDEGGRYRAVLSYCAHLYNRGFSIPEMWAQVQVNLAPLFKPRLSDRELHERFTRATTDMERELGERRSVPAVAIGPLEDGALTEFDSRPVEWLWPSWLPKGVVTVMDGNPGVAKSTLVADLVARLSTGRRWPDEQPTDRPQRAMWITTEDDPGRVLRPRIEAAGGDTAMILFVRSEVVFPDVADPFRELLVRRAAEPLGLGLVVLDPLFSHISAKVRTIADAEMRRGVMNPMQDAADAANTSILVVRHFNKDETSSAINRGAGSLGGIVGAARALWTVATDPEDESGETKAIGVAKLNYARKPPTLRYRVIDRVPDGWLTGSVSGIEWLGQAPIDITQILQESPASRDAQPVLTTLLRQGPMQADAVLAAMKARGFGRDATRGAAARLGVQKAKSGMVGGWTWTLPTEESDAAEESEASGANSSDDSSDSSPRARARREDPLPDSSDSSKSRKVRVPGSPSREGAGARDPDPHVTCHFPKDHSTAWQQRSPGQWFCSICEPAA
jgi:hypothetical protein